MKTFIQLFGKNILSVLHGFDRLRFRGTRRFLANVAGMMKFLWQRQVLLKNFEAFAGDITAEPVQWQGKRVRALNPGASADARLLEAVNRDEFAINAFRNRDLRQLLFDKPAKDETEERQQSAAITRQLRLLRAHGLIRKVPKTHRYQISPHGSEVINAVLAARQASIAKFVA